MVPPLSMDASLCQYVVSRCLLIFCVQTYGIAPHWILGTTWKCVLQSIQPDPADAMVTGMDHFKT
uniref:Uncharacterized protein n=1 Tax=Anguilla anguilla TaxID=7936 RepID=A0A0E9PM70_ANGAN